MQKKTKRCSCCKTTKAASEFGKDKKRKDGCARYCKSCLAAKARKKYKENPKHREYCKKIVKKYRAENPIKVKKQKRDWELQHKYKITLDDYNEMLDKQQGCCAICGKHYSQCEKLLHVDHNHSTGKVRELLCYTCNIRLAVVENKNFVEVALEYLKKHE